MYDGHAVELCKYNILQLAIIKMPFFDSANKLSWGRGGGAVVLREKDYLKPVEVCGHYDSGASKKINCLRSCASFL